MHQSAFTHYLLANQRFISASTFREVKAAAVARITERLRAARADCELTFNDLWERCEREIAPRA